LFIVKNLKQHCIVCYVKDLCSGIYRMSSLLYVYGCFQWEIYYFSKPGCFFYEHTRITLLTTKLKHRSSKFCNLQYLQILTFTNVSNVNELNIVVNLFLSFTFWCECTECMGSNICQRRIAWDGFSLISCSIVINLRYRMKIIT